MTSDPLTTDVSNRICDHMNKDHQDTLRAFAKHYGSFDKPGKAKMVSITSLAMEINIDGEPLEIKFDHTLADSQDAHQTLVTMHKAILENN